MAQFTVIIEPSAPVRLTPEQRTIIYRSATGASRVTLLPRVELAAGARVPSGAVLSTLPDVYVEVPSVKRYRYV